MTVQCVPNAYSYLEVVKPPMCNYFLVDEMQKHDSYALLRQQSNVSKVMKSITRKNRIDTLMQIFLAEFFGAACLMYFGCMGCFGSVTEVAKLPPMQGGLVFGFVVASLIQGIGHISDAHLNPSVTLCALILKRINVYTAIIYLIAECLGCTFGLWLLQATTQDIFIEYMTSNSTSGFCTTTIHPSIGIVRGFSIEFLCTAFLMYVVCSVWDSRNAHNSDSTPLKFGILVAALSIAAGPFTGCSMNPARSFAPALINSVWDAHWVYWFAPLSGSLCSTLFYKYCFTTPEHPSEKSTDTVLKSPDSPIHESKPALGGKGQNSV
ncbi:aquaporin-like isoform X2 [Planococcus citri]|uniref:aquaporin-like isoform X2 n=1 Tax=Planococcus citri TaxID=170843 RepID=UPI0031F9CC97